MTAVNLAALTVTKPVAIAGIVIVALVALYVAFKVGKFILKMLLWLFVLTAIVLAAWWFYTTHYGAP